MTTKLFEIRDKATFVPMMATLIAPLTGLGQDHATEAEAYLMQRAGYGGEPCVILCKLECPDTNRNATYEPHAWGGHTYLVAHLYILANWDALKSGDVIDVEFILGETTQKKTSEATAYPL